VNENHKRPERPGSILIYSLKVFAQPLRREEDCPPSKEIEADQEEHEARARQKVTGVDKLNVQHARFREVGVQNEET
jgi:hypothetical protein